MTYRGQITHWTQWQAQWLSTLQFSSGYSQVTMHEKDKQRTSFRTRTVMSFRFYNAFITFESLMEQVLDGTPWEAPLICPDDTISHAKSLSDKLRLRCCFQEAPSGRTKTESKKVPLVPQACFLPWSRGQQRRYLHWPDTEASAGALPLLTSWLVTKSSSLHVNGFSDSVDLWVIKIKIPLSFAHVVCRDQIQQITKHRWSI